MVTSSAACGLRANILSTSVSRLTPVVTSSGSGVRDERSVRRESFVMGGVDMRMRSSLNRMFKVKVNLVYLYDYLMMQAVYPASAAICSSLLLAGSAWITTTRDTPINRYNVLHIHSDVL